MIRSRIAAALVVAGLVACGDAADSPARPSLLVITVDGLRRDVLGIYGAQASPMPELDAWGERAVVFEEAFTPAPAALPAYASLWTGRSPLSHGARAGGTHDLADGATTLAEHLGSEGYRCAARVGRSDLGPASGLAQGFASYDAPLEAVPRIELGPVERRADALVGPALEDLARLEASGEPFLYWLHLADANPPYDAPGSGAETARAAYGDELRFVDAALGQLLGGLEHEDLVVVVGAGYGAGLEDGREAGHGLRLHATTVNVPLMLKAPGLGSQRVRGPVSLVDMAATLLELCGLDPMAESDGLGLVSAIERGAAPDQRVLTLEAYRPYADFGWAPLQGVVRGRHKLILAHEIEVYDRAEDPHETNNRYRPRDALSQGLLGQLQAAFAADRRPEGLADPAEQEEILARVAAVEEQLVAGDVAAAWDLLQELYALDRGNPYVQTRLGEIGVLEDHPPMQRVEEAAQLLAAAVRHRPADPRPRWLLSRAEGFRAGEAKRSLGRAERRGDEALIAARRAEFEAQLASYRDALRGLLTLRPEHAEALQALAVSLVEEGGDPAEALEMLDRRLALAAPDDPARATLEALREGVAERLGAAD